ncbi:ribosomal protection-like ABC-F family protein [Acetobacterium woodii]|uniref:ABC transport system ATP-binding protein n=1 Tax=Acetobacterium woodii (strain ATCC 29683 / DSM 1030 / JCM 2381 / KCTC 1655 / WB1) TaxID=931626 RepID=H6LGE8_ACEWD|nr:ABC-F type ribosomal protection protein [Acetobacterium woodii]AFA47084.1 ABC transport system ATP-binding protein [Acetobacterium woodii DSM 1030]
MSQINISQLTFNYENSYHKIFEDVSFTIDSNWKLGFIGRNGRGKTTFLKLLMGLYDYSGVISSSVNFEYFPFDVPDPSLSTIFIVDSIFDDYEPWELDKELSLLKLNPEVLNRSFETLSRGEQTKILLVALFLKPNSFLLIDEPTNHLDLDGRMIVSDYLNKKSGFILVSHDRNFLDGCIDHVLSINKTDIDIQKGNYSSWAFNKQRQDQFELNQHKKLKQEIGHLKTAAKRTENWSQAIEKSKKGQRVSGLRPDRGHIGHQSAKMMKRSKSLEKRQEKNIQEKEKLLKNIDWSASLQLKPQRYKKERLISINHLSLFYDERQIIKNFNLTINQGDRIALIGKNGSGKSSLLKLLLGEPLTFQGDLIRGSQLTLSHIPQETGFLKGDLRRYAQDQNLNESLFKTILQKLGFSREQFEKDLASFSEGQKKKVYLARSLCQPAHLYLWDEPLNHIDVLSRIQIETLLLQTPPTMVFIEHDRSFIDQVATKIIELS